VAKEDHMTSLAQSSLKTRSGKLHRLYLSSIAFAEVVAFGGLALAQSAASAKPATLNAVSTVVRTQAPLSQAYVDFLLAFKMADDGSRPEALQRLAESIRLQPRDNPASGLLFQLLTEQRANSRLILRGHKGAITYAAYSPDGSKIITASADHTARIWDARTGDQLTPALEHDDDVLMAEFSQDGTLVITASEDGTARIWEVATGHEIGNPIKAPEAVTIAHLSPDGRQVIAAWDNNARIFDATTGQPVSPPIAYHENICSVNFSPDGLQAVTATGDSVADIVDGKTGLRIKPLRQNNTIFTAVYSRDGRTILTASQDHTAMMWDAKTGQPVGPVFRHGFSIESAVFNYDASRVLTVSLDHTAQVWDAKTGRPITPPLLHSEGVLRGGFSPDGYLVVTSSRDRTVRLWDSTTGEPLRLPIRSNGAIGSVIFNPSGSSLLVASSDGTAQVVDMPPYEPAPAWVSDLADFASTQINYDSSRTPDMEKIRALRATLLASKGTDPWSVFGRWYFTENTFRPISPWSTVTLQQYVESLVARGDKDSLQYAAELAYDHPAWMVKIVPMRNKLAASAAAASAKH
jgi:WD40 repeat protein